MRGFFELDVVLYIHKLFPHVSELQSQTLVRQVQTLAFLVEFCVFLSVLGLILSDFEFELLESGLFLLLQSVEVLSILLLAVVDHLPQFLDFLVFEGAQLADLVLEFSLVSFQQLFVMGNDPL